MLARLAGSLPTGPVRLIYNAAYHERDVGEDGRVDVARLELTNRVNVDGFARTLAAFQEPLLARGGLLVGVTSINAVKPPILEPRVGYGATKAYLSMALRNLALAWPSRIRCMEARLGHVGAEPGAKGLAALFVAKRQHRGAGAVGGRLPQATTAAAGHPSEKKRNGSTR